MPELYVVLGAGESGTGAALLAKAKGLPVFVSDFGAIGATFKAELEAAGIEYEEKGHSEERILTAAEVIKSPGIPDSASIVQKLLTKGTPVVSELEFAARYTEARFIAITGSNGKTTTTLLTYHLLKCGGLNAGLAGNVGFSLARQVITDKFDWYVLEVSSFQLDGMYRFRANISVVLNITPDHLDRYNYLFSNYVASKFRVLQNQTAPDTFITFPESEAVGEELSRRRILPQLLSISLQTPPEQGAFLSGENLAFTLPGSQAFEIPLSLLPLRGPHNYLNAMAAVLAAVKAGVSVAAVKEALPSFENAPHRLQYAGTLNGVRFINDSKATNVDSVKYALGSFTEPLILIAGGKDKGNDYTEIEEAVTHQVQSLVCMGLDNSPLIRFFGGKVPRIVETKSAEEAVRVAYGLAKPGYVVLLSPACASFDLFKNYEDRGRQFCDAVQKLITENTSA